MTPYEAATTKLRPHERINRLERLDAHTWRAYVFSLASKLYRRFEFTV